MINEFILSYPNNYFHHMESDLDKLTAISKSHNTSLIFDSVVGGLKGYVISDNIENVMETVSKINLYLSSQNR